MDEAFRAYIKDIEERIKRYREALEAEPELEPEPLEISKADALKQALLKRKK